MIIIGAIASEDNKRGVATGHHNRYFKKAKEKTWNIEEF
jgi:hypothetical protein